MVIFGVNDCLPKGKIPAELKQDESKHDSRQENNAEVVKVNIRIIILRRI